MPTSRTTGTGRRREKLPGRSAGRRFLTETDIQQIREIVRTWPCLPLTWEGIRERVVREVQHVDVRSKGAPSHGSDAHGWTRQALSRQPAIKDAYDCRKQELAGENDRVRKSPNRNRDPEIVMLRRERDALRIRVSELERKIAAYEEKFTTLIYNKALGAASDDEMHRRLPIKIDRRGRT